MPSKNLFIAKNQEGFTQEQAQHQLERLLDQSIGTTYKYTHNWSGRVASLTQEGSTFKAELILKKQQKRIRDTSNDVFEKHYLDIFKKLINNLLSANWAPTEENKIEKEMSFACPKQNLDITLPSEIEPHFRHIYDRAAQIRIVYASIQNAVRTQFNKRSHCVLYGPPACGKTSILNAFRDMLGDENFVTLDATSTTKAGAENKLLDYDKVPPFIILEEIEKCNPGNLPWLLGVMDQRAEINKVNARTGTRRREAKCLCLATVNNIREFKTIMSGALASRFQHKVFCPRPSPQILRQILKREIAEIGGDERWIEPALEYAVKEEKTSDPRRVISLLDGGDRLLTGEYQDDLRSIRLSMEGENQEDLL